MKIELSSRLSQLAPLRNARMEQALATAIGRFHDVEKWKLTIGSPDTPPHAAVVQALIAAAADPTKYGYITPPFGSRKLFKAAAAFRNRHHNVELNWQTEVTSVHGARKGTFDVVCAVTNPGDLVMIPALHYPGTRTAVVMAGCTPVYYSALPGTNTADQMTKCYAECMRIQKRPPKLGIVYPIGNPNGNAIPYKVFPELVSFANDTNTPLLSDEAYLYSLFPGHQAHSLMQFEGGKLVGVSMYTMSKLANAPSLRAALVDGSEVMIEAVKRVTNSLEYGLAWWIQEAMMAALSAEQDEFPAESAALYAVRHAAVKRVAAKHRIEVWDADGGMFAVVVIPQKWQALGSREVAAIILEQTGVRINAGADHGPEGDRILRVALVANEPVIEEGMERMFELLTSDPPTTNELPENAGDFQS